MTDYCVTMARSPSLTDAECRARLYRVYQALIEIGRKAQAADRESLDNEARTTPSKALKQHLGSAEESDDG